MKTKNTVIKWINTFAFLSMVTVNVLANLIPIGIGITGTVSEKYGNLFTPATVTFYIWGVIYVMLAVFILYQWGIFDHGERSAEFTKKISPWFWTYCAFNIGWIFAWHFDVIWLSLIFTLLMLVSVIVITRVAKHTDAEKFDYTAAVSGFDITYGWTVVALIANAAVLLTKLNWNGFGLSNQFWTVLILLVAAGIANAMAVCDGKWLSALTVIWAFTGILIKHISRTGFAGKYVFVIIAAIIGIVFICLGIFVGFLIRHFKNADWEEKKAACTKYRCKNAKSETTPDNPAAVNSTGNNTDPGKKE